MQVVIHLVITLFFPILLLNYTFRLPLSRHLSRIFLSSGTTRNNLQSPFYIYTFQMSLNIFTFYYFRYLFTFVPVFWLNLNFSRRINLHHRICQLLRRRSPASLIL